MASFVLLAVCFVLIIYKAYKYMFFKPPNFPPGPPRIPFFGAYLLMLMINYNHLQLAVDWLCKYYKTNIIGLYIGTFLSVIANDSASIKEIMLNTKLDGRPDQLLLAKLRDPNNVTRGIFFTQGLYWRDHRRFTLRYLRDFGFGRRFHELELEIEDELRQMIDMIKSGPKYPHEKEFFNNDGLVVCPNVFYPLASNSFVKVLFNERIPRENQGDLLKAAQHTYSFLKNGDSYGRMFSLLPWIAKVFPGLSGYTKVRDAALSQYEFMKTLVDDQYKTYDENHVRHFLDLYFQEMKAKQRNRYFKHADFDYEQLIMTCTDFFMAVSVSLPIMIAFYLRQMILNPQMKRRVQDEIDNIVGRSRLPTLDDRNELHYTEASVREILRYNTLVPNGVPRVALESTQLLEYDIPQYTVIATGLRSGHLDSSKWDDPSKFQPERYLDENGRLDLKKDHSLPFGAGKRLCAGETHARNVMFLLIAAILQNFDISMPDQSKLPSDDEIMTGLISIVPNYLIKFDSR